MRNNHGKVTLGALMMGLVVFLLFIMVGMNMYLLLKDDDDTAAEAEAEVVEEAEPIEIIDPIFVKVGPMTVNIKSTHGERLLYTSMMVKVSDDETAKFLRIHLPDINNRMLILLSQQTAEQLTEPDGKAGLAEKIMEVLQAPFATPQPELALESVLFQDFIVQ